MTAPMAAPQQAPTYPSAPSSLADLGVPDVLIEDLILQRLVLDGRSSVTRMAAATALSVGIVDAAVDSLRQRMYLEIQGMDGRDYILAPTDKGKTEAMSRGAACTYAGAAPVSLEDYTSMVEAQKGRSPITPATLSEAFADLVIAPGFLDDLGPALVSKGAVFLYGPPGTGKTSLAERMIKMYKDPVLVPRAVEFDGQIITVFDPSLHEPVAPQPSGMDPRWVLCNRPCVIVGGELTNKQLELERDVSTGVYRAPLQMKANNGIFVIDDFAPEGSVADVHRLHRKAARLFRAQGNRSGRQRMRADTTPRSPVKKAKPHSLSLGSQRSIYSLRTPAIENPE